MIKPAQLYKEEIKKKYIETWYNEEYMYYSGWSGVEEPRIFQTTIMILIILFLLITMAIY